MELMNRRRTYLNLVLLSFASLLLTQRVSADITQGRMNSAEKCKSLCIDQGGTFCKPFGVYDWGYCCYTDMGLPCDKRTQACSNGNNEITRYF